MPNFNRSMVLAAAAVLMTTAAGHAEEKRTNPDLPFASGPPEQCISLQRIDHSEIVDDQNILFYMKGDEVYRNYLPHDCPGLSTHDAFMYRTSLSQLCSLDIVTVLMRMGFNGFTPGASCGLGMFYPVTEQDVAGLKTSLEDPAAD